MERTLREIVFGGIREKRYVEGTVLGGIICPMIKLNGYVTYIYGCGGGIIPLVLYLENNGIEVKAIIDKSKEKSGKLVLEKIPVIHTDEMAQTISDPENAFVLINVLASDISQMEIISLLYNNRLMKYYTISDFDKAYHIYAGLDRNCVEYFRNHVDDLENLYDDLVDETSKCVLKEYIRTLVEGGIYSLEQCSGNVKYFYGADIVRNKSYEELYRHLDNEVWINCGASIGDNVFLYFANGLDAKQVYAFEGNKTIYNKLCANLMYLPEAYRTKVTAVNEFIDEKTDFHRVIGDNRVTLINADLDGSEMDMLRNISNVIKQDKPVLAICVYHKLEDLIEIPQYISKLVSDYKFILRKYNAFTTQPTQIDELVLYAIPGERMVIRNCSEITCDKDAV